MSGQIRQARPEDAVAIAGVHITGVRAAYPELAENPELAGNSEVDRRARHWTGWLRRRRAT